MLCTQCTRLPSKLLPLCVDNLLFHSLCMHNSCTIIILCFCHPWLTLLLPNIPVSQRGGEPQQLLAFLQQKTVEKNAHIKELKSTTSGTSGVYCVCIVYMSACEECCRLCDNSIPFKVYKEKLRGAAYITVFDSVCHNFEKILVM